MAGRFLVAVSLEFSGSALLAQHSGAGPILSVGVRKCCAELSGSFRQNALRPFLGFVSPNHVLLFPQVRFAKPSAVIAREGGRSSNRQAIITGCPACAGHDSSLCCRSSYSSIQTPSVRGRGRPVAFGECPPSEGGEAPTSAGAERRTRW